MNDASAISARIALQDRNCGSCNLCCKIMVIEELAKPAGKWCSHAAPGRGCNIYGAHPRSCQQFSCLWLSTLDMPEALRPDRCKVVMALDADGTRLIAHGDAASPDAWRKRPIFPFLQAQARRAWGRGHVLARVGNAMWLITPDAVLGMGTIAPETPYRIEHRPEGIQLSMLRSCGDQEVAAETFRLGPGQPQRTTDRERV